MDVTRMRVLRELADRGTIAATAAALNLTASAVSQQLKILAKEAGVALLEPDGRRLRLTDAGTALVLRSDEVLAALDRAHAQMKAFSDSPQGRVRVALFPSGAALLLPGLLSRMANSGVQLECSDVDRPPSAVPELLADFDVVLTHRSEQVAPISAPRVLSTVLMREPIDVIFPQNHRLAAQDVVQLEDLADENWISVRDGFPVGDVLISIAAITGTQPRIIQRINEFRVIEQLVAAGHGIALMPRYAVTHAGVRRVIISGVRAARLYELATRRESRKLPAIAAVCSGFITEVAALKQD
ncbi:MAG: LysR substrate-binding domain-containing protein [Mycobacteriaceae bacterium]